MSIIKKVFEFWKYDQAQIALLLENNEKPYFLRLEKLIQITQLPIQLLPALVGSEVVPIFYEVGEATDLGFVAYKKNTFVKDLQFQYSKSASVFRFELGSVPLKIGDFIVVNGTTIDPSGAQSDAFGSDDYWINYIGENTMQVDRFALVGDEKRFALVCSAFVSEQEQLTNQSFERVYYKPEYYIEYQSCRLATIEEINEFEVKQLEHRESIRESTREQIYQTEYEKDTFDALTDGQIGDFDEFESANSSLRDYLGL